MFKIFLSTLMLGAFAMTDKAIGEIKDCPQSPNCVSTLTDQKDKLMQPISWQKEDTDPKEITLEVLKSQPRTTIEVSKDNFIHAVCSTRFLKFKDDVYFYFDAENKQIHFKSQSRVGYSDFGKNRSRMEKISKLIREKIQHAKQ